MDNFNRALFGIAEDHLEEYQSLDRRFVKNKASTYFFEAKGNAMAPLVNDGDILLVDRSLKVEHNAIGIVCYHNQFLCRRILFENKWIILTPENNHFKKTIITDEEDISFFGGVSTLVRKFKKP